ncbi:carboxymuconolactone decarboxylase family protein [Roseateles cellulosilyticus]|uniref:Carboxymuconolactone decarboxylase family protein n=1 Tax=Pelomonas cellulosilytica TaxID=2906762 RepID=A0ABS8XRQ8_9BURK|nr:carboxymuconolactone decarboxylase family protein [Pelomonas sp. P8]MCE4553975.1 carboxymuconolactone decarboxylase family protein [Pelomonas sp. P8]
MTATRSRLPRLDANTAPTAAQPLVAKVIANNGFLPHLIGTLANAPVALETYLTVSEINSRSSLDVAAREVVQITAAQLNGCDFCVAGHSALALKKAQLPVDTVQRLQAVQPTGHARLDALQAFTKAVIENRGAVPDAALQAFLGAGFGPQQVLEVVLGVSLATLCNYANVLAGNEINPELQPYAAGQLK